MKLKLFITIILALLNIAWIAPTGQITIKLESWSDSDIDKGSDSNDTLLSWTEEATSTVDESIFDTEMATPVQSVRWKVVVDDTTNLLGSIAEDSAPIYSSTASTVDIKCMAEYDYTIVTATSEVETDIETGVNWTDTIAIDRTSLEKPSFAVENDGPIHIVCRDTTTYPYQIIYTISTNGGSTWTDRGQITSSAPKQTNPNNSKSRPDIAVESDGTIHVVWEEQHLEIASPKWLIDYAYSTDDGATWQYTGAIATSPNDQYNPKIAVENDGTIHVIWSEKETSDSTYRLQYAFSTNDGSMWTDRGAIDDDGANQELADNSDIAVENDGTIHVVWAEYDSTIGSNQINYAFSINDGSAWTDRGKVVTSATNTQVHPRIAVESDGTIHLYWVSDELGGMAVYVPHYAFSTDDGATWTIRGQILYNAITSNGFGDITADASSTVHIAWTSSNGGMAAYAFSTNDGSTWTYRSTILPDLGAFQYGCNIVAETDKTVHIVFYMTGYNADGSPLSATGQVMHALTIPETVYRTRTTYTYDTVTLTKLILTDTWTTSGGNYLFRFYVVDGRDNHTNMEDGDGTDKHVLSGTDAYMDYTGDADLGVSDNEIKLVRVNRKSVTPTIIGVD